MTQRKDLGDNKATTQFTFNLQDDRRMTMTMTPAVFHISICHFVVLIKKYSTTNQKIQSIEP
jgi:hypothetical protein